MRYEITIEFYYHTTTVKKVLPIVEKVKTMKEVREIAALIDYTVKSAYVKDLVTDLIINRFK